MNSHDHPVDCMIMQSPVQMPVQMPMQMPMQMKEHR